MSKHAAKRLKQFEVLGRHFLDKTKEIVEDAEAAELKAKESETKALKGKKQMPFNCIDKNLLARITKLFRLKILFYLKALLPVQLDY